VGKRSGEGDQGNGRVVAIAGFLVGGVASVVAGPLVENIVRAVEMMLMMMVPSCGYNTRVGEDARNGLVGLGEHQRT